jgi:serine/threonine-protein kinase
MADPATTPAPASMEADLSGRQLGDYRILRRLGRGGMAEVYLAEQLSLRRQVALKVLRKTLASDDKYIKRFHAEAQAAASLVHANIVQIHEVGCVEGVHYIAQEYVQGHNLREYLSRDGLPDLRLAVKVMCSVAAALHRAAERGIVHRDIKPENIMLAKSGEVKVADFGLARRTQEDTLNLTQVGQTMGTPLYMSPEQVEGKNLDPRSDIYSLGVTCYHMLAGHPPFRGDTALSIAVQHLKNPAERLENKRPDLPPNLCRIVHTMLAKEPGSRYPSARELLRELRALRSELDGEGLLDAAYDDGLDPADLELAGRSRAATRLDTLMKTSMMRQTRRNKAPLWVLAGAIAFGLGAAGAWSLRPSSILQTPAAEASSVAAQPTAAAQAWYASLVKTAEAWKAVLEYHPDDGYFVNEAHRELGMLYLQSGAEDQAREHFDELASLRDDTEAEFRAFGLAGQAVVLSLEGKNAESNIKLADLLPIMDKLTDYRMRLMLGDIKRENDRILKRQANEEFDRQWEKQLLERQQESG